MPNIEHTLEDKIRIGTEICKKYESGEFTIASCCDTQGITDRTFNRWCSEVSELSDIYKKAKGLVRTKLRGDLKQMALTSLAKLVKGYETEETHQELEPVYDKDGKQIGVTAVKVRKVKKSVGPHPTAVIFTLKSLDESFREPVDESELEEQYFIIGGQKLKF